MYVALQEIIYLNILTEFLKIMLSDVNYKILLPHNIENE